MVSMNESTETLDHAIGVLTALRDGMLTSGIPGEPPDDHQVRMALNAVSYDLDLAAAQMGLHTCDNPLSCSTCLNEAGAKATRRRTAARKARRHG